MILDEVKQLAIKRLTEDGLYPAWKVKFKSVKSYAGSIEPQKKKGDQCYIVLNNLYVEQASEKEVLEVIDHEIAHVLSIASVLGGMYKKEDLGSAHGWLWKQIMIDMGYPNPKSFVCQVPQGVLNVHD